MARTLQYFKKLVSEDQILHESLMVIYCFEVGFDCC